MAPQLAFDDVPPPRGWLLVSFLGVWLYLIAQILQIYVDRVAAAVALPASEVLDTLGVLSVLGSIFVLSGLVTALWRANLAAGLSPAGVRGLVLGAAGVGVLVLFDLALVLNLIGVGGQAVRALIDAQAVLNVFGNALSLAGLASLAVGLAHAASLFGRPEAEATGSEARAEP